MSTTTVKMSEAVNTLNETLEATKNDVAVILLSNDWKKFEDADLDYFANTMHTLDAVNKKFRELFDRAVWAGHVDGSVPKRITSIRKQSDSDTPRGRKPLTVQEKAANLWK